MTLTLEKLPNEILLMAFEHLSPMDLFNGLYELNSRFNHICNNIPISIDFNKISNGQFIRLHRPILHRFAHSIFHLTLSNKDSDGKICFFLEYFQLDNFSNLQTLELYYIHDIDIEKIALQLSNLKHLKSLFIEEAYRNKEENSKALHAAIFHHEQRSLRTLILHSDYNFSMEYMKVSNIQYLSLSKRMNIPDLFELFTLMPKIKTLLLENFVWLDDDENFFSDINKYAFKVANLRRLEIPFNRNHDFHKCRFKQIEILLSYFPYLQSLLMIRTTRNWTNYDDDGISCVDAQQLQHLIESLPHLIKFEFIINIDFSGVRPFTINTILAPFCTDFWLNRNICVVIDCYEKSRFQIYTLPFPGFSSRRHPTSLYDAETKTNNHPRMMKNLYVNLDELHLKQETLESSSAKLQIHRYAKLRNLNLLLGNIFDEQKFIKGLRKMIVLSRVKQLTLTLDDWEYSDQCTEFPLQILECTPNVDTLYITWCWDMSDLFQNDKFWASLNKIKNIHFVVGFTLLLDGLDRFLSIFSNIETLYIELQEVDLCIILPKLLNELIHLTYLKCPRYITETRPAERHTLHKGLVLKCLANQEIIKRYTFKWDDCYYFIWLHER